MTDRPTLGAAVRASGEQRRQRAAERQQRAREQSRIAASYAQPNGLDQLAKKELDAPGFADGVDLPPHMRTAIKTRAETLKRRAAHTTGGTTTP